MKRFRNNYPVRNINVSLAFDEMVPKTKAIGKSNHHPLAQKFGSALARNELVIYVKKAKLRKIMKSVKWFLCFKAIFKDYCSCLIKRLVKICP